MREDLVRRVRQFLLIIILAGLAITSISTWWSARAGDGPAWLVRLAGPSQDLVGRHIGIVAGHSGNDSGAVCPDGLTEASTNLAIARDVVTGLKRRGATVDLLAEFDERLHGYQADALVSIHADSCEVDFSGFKVASEEGGTLASGRLADCLWVQYAAVTDLKRHTDTISSDMLNYHAFREVDGKTPAAIIETGFLKADRDLLTQGHAQAADGIIGGIECFLVPPPTPTPAPS